MGLYKYVVCL